MLVIANALSAHSFDHLEIEVLKELAKKQQEKLEHRDQVIATQAQLIVVLEKEVHDLKHEVRNSKYHELKKFLKTLGF